jgi:hypothetical protein
MQLRGLPESPQNFRTQGLNTLVTLTPAHALVTFWL